MIQFRFHKNIVFLLVFCLPIFAFSQSRFEQRKFEFYHQIDSLKLHPEKLSLHYIRGGYPKDSLLIYYQEVSRAYQDIQQELNKAQQIYFLYEIGQLEILTGKYDEAEETFEIARTLFDKDHENYWNPDVYISYYLADALRATGKTRKSNDIFLSILDIPLVQKDSAIQMEVKGCISENFEAMGDFDDAMELCIQLYNYHLRNKNYTPASYNLIQLGRIAAHIESDTSYFEYYHMANDLAIKSGDTARLSNNLVNMGIAYKNAGYPYLGLKYLKEAEKYYYHQRLYGRTHLLLALSEAYYGVDSVSKAITISKRARQDALKINVFDLIYHVNLKLVKYYKSLNEIDSSRRYMLLAIKDSKSLDHRISFQHLYKQISDMSLQMNDYPNAMAYLDSSYLEYEKFLSKTNNDKLVQLREKSDYYLHRNKISQLVSDNVLEQEKSMKLKIVIFAVLFVLVLTVYFTFIVRKRLKQLKESYVTLVKKSIEQDKLNKQLRECEVKHKKKVKHENISGEDLIIKNFKKLLYQEEIFTDTHLSLKSLADNLNTNTSYLSAIINSHFNCNLRTLINKHRIDKAREMLVSKEFDHYSMEGISSEVGFSSRSGFYQAFKAATGLSPSLYIENYQLVISSK